MNVKLFRIFSQYPISVLSETICDHLKMIKSGDYTINSMDEGLPCIFTRAAFNPIVRFLHDPIVLERYIFNHEAQWHSNRMAFINFSLDII